MKSFFSPLRITAMSLVGIVMLLVYVNIFLGVLVYTTQPKSIPFVLPSLAQYPFVSTSPLPTDAISADAAIIMDNDSKVIIFDKNPGFQFSPASTTKLMTALVGFDYFKPTDILPIKVATTEGSLLGFIPGQKITFENLLYAMFLPSANDAAQNIAANIPGGIDAFVSKMNEKAQKLYLTHTHFADPAGLLDDETYTTPEELVRLAAVVIKNPIIEKIVNTPYKIIATTDGKQYELKNLNKLLGLYGVNGIKTGHTEGAKDVLITSVKKGTHTILIAVMKSDDRFADTTTLIQRVVNTITYSPIPQ